MKTTLLAGAWDCSSRSTRAASAQKTLGFSFRKRRRGTGCSAGASEKHQLRAQPLCEMCLARGQVTAACICDHVEPHGGDWNRFWLTLPAPSPLPIALR